MADLRGAYARLRRAQVHLADFKRRAERYNRSHLNHLIYDFHQETQRAGVQWGKGRAPSVGMSMIVGETIYNLRAALDYLVYEMAELDSGSEQDGTQFPIESSKKGFKGRRKSYLNGVDAKHVTALRALQPCEGCNWTGVLRDISNPDKHRKLTDSRGTAVIDVKLAYIPPGGQPPPQPWKVFPAQGRLRGEVWDVYVHADATLHVEFADGTPVAPTLDLLQGEVAATLNAFTPCFEGRCAH